ncbi:MAG: hypothetical protein WCL44_13170 [bacterium]
MPVPILIHLVLLVLMVLFCVAAAVVGWRRAGRWLPLHKLLGLLGACVGLAGIAVMVALKIVADHPHLKSTHAVVGLVAGILLVAVPLLGLLATRGFGMLRMPNRILARILIVLGLVALVTGVLRYAELTKPATPPAGSRQPAAKE